MSPPLHLVPGWPAHVTAQPAGFEHFTLHDWQVTSQSPPHVMSHGPMSVQKISLPAPAVTLQVDALAHEIELFAPALTAQPVAPEHW